MSNEVKTILVLGAGGTMGNGICHIAALAGYNVHAHDIKEEFVNRGIETIEKNLGRQASRGNIEEAAIQSTLSRITGFTDLKEAAQDVDFVIEAVPENVELKIDLYRQLEDHLGEDVIIASNTSTISISLLAGGSERQDRFIGMHFFNPPAMMNLIEIINGLATTDQTLEITKGVAERMDKEVIIAKDSPGFIVNRILVPMLNEAVFALQDGVGTVEDIDKGIKLGLGHPMGPFTLLDLIGLDTALHVSDSFYEQYQDSKYRVAPLLRKMVHAGKLGRKSGEGFYKYD